MSTTLTTSHYARESHSSVKLPFAFSSICWSFISYKCFTVAADVHADLSLPSSSNVDLVETKIVSYLRSSRTATDDQSQDGSSMTTLIRLLRRLGMNRRRFFARKVNSISSLFICESVEELQMLREHYKSGLMKEVLQAIFTALADEPVSISRLEWTTDQYDSCLQQLGMFHQVRVST